jgi:hypothetical protein
MRTRSVYVVGVALLAAALAGCSTSHPSKPSSSAPRSMPTAPSQVAVTPVTTTRGHRTVVFALAA